MLYIALSSGIVIHVMTIDSIIQGIFLGSHSWHLSTMLVCHMCILTVHVNKVLVAIRVYTDLMACIVTQYICTCDHNLELSTQTCRGCCPWATVPWECLFGVFLKCGICISLLSLSCSLYFFHCYNYFPFICSIVLASSKVLLGMDNFLPHFVNWTTFFKMINKISWGIMAFCEWITNSAIEWIKLTHSNITWIPSIQLWS